MALHTTVSTCHYKVVPSLMFMKLCLKHGFNVEVVNIKKLCTYATYQA